MLNLVGFEYKELFTDEGIARLDQEFLDSLNKADSSLAEALHDYRAQGLLPASKAQSEFLLRLAPHVEQFITRLFALEKEVSELHTQTRSHDVVMEFKKHFVLRRARRYRGEFPETFADLDQWLDSQIRQRAWPDTDREWAISRLGEDWLKDENTHAEEIQRLTQWCALILQDLSLIHI